MTEKNHYNPCFWTAFWNKEYYENYMQSQGKSLKAREQIVNCLIVKNGEVKKLKTENIFFNRNQGIAKINEESIANFINGINSEQKTKLLNTIIETTNSYIDFENNFSAIEKKVGYPLLLKIIQFGTLNKNCEKLELAFLILFHNIRNPLSFNSMVRDYKNCGIEKFEIFLNFKNDFFLKKEIIAKSIMLLSAFKWILHESNDKSIPLGDCAIFRERSNLFFILSPKLILEITDELSPFSEVLKVKLEDNKYYKIINRIVFTSYNHIIAIEESILSEIANSFDFKNQQKIVNRDDFKSKIRSTTN
jgi:hypothetical protein